MYYNIVNGGYLPIILVVGEQRRQLASNSAVLSGFKQVNISVVEAMTIVAWVQQHQPDLIIFDMEYRQIINLGLITALRLDWLTRKIPILVIGNLITSELQSRASLDCDAYLKKPYTVRQLEQAICSLVPTPACKFYLTTV